MHTFPAIPWLEDWKRVSGVEPTAQRDYVKSELERIAKAGAPVLSMVLMAPFDIQTHLALSLLHQRALPQHRFWFRLVNGAKPPERDPQGRELADDERGKVLVAKVGTLGGQINQSHMQPPAITSPFEGPALKAAEWEGRDIYQYVRITREASEINLSDAVIMLRRYGWQIAAPRYKGRSKHRNPDGSPERDCYGGPIQEIDFWMVEEIPPQFINNDGTVRERMASSQQNKGKAA